MDTTDLGADYRTAMHRVRVVRKALGWMPYPGEAPTDRDMQQLSEARLEVQEFIRHLENKANYLAEEVLDSIEAGTHVLEKVV